MLWLGNESCQGNFNGQLRALLNGETYQLKWRCRQIYFSADSEKYYNFTELACQLNEPEEGVAPTDSRLRPDQRLMEKGDWDGANAQKVRLEEKQRATRRQREEEAEKAASKGDPHMTDLFSRRPVV